MAKRNGVGVALLADETRRRIVALLAARPRRPSSIAIEIGRSRPATSRQLRLLEDAGLIRAFRSMIDGRGYVYRINPAESGRIIAWLAGTEIGLADPPAEPQPAAPADAHHDTPRCARSP